MIRAIAPSDLDETLRVFRASCAASHAFLPEAFIAQSEQSMRERSLLAAETRVLDDGAIRGFLCRHGTFIEALFVDPAFQSRGLGKALLDHAKTESRTLCLSVFAKNLRAVRFYQRERFWATGLKDHRPTGETLVLLKWEESGAKAGGDDGHG